MSTAAGRRRVPYDRPLRPRVIATRVALVLLLVFVLLIGFSPWRRTIVTSARNQVARVVPGLHRDLATESAATVAGSPAAAPRFNARRAVDGFSNTAWSAPFMVGGDGVPAECEYTPSGDAGSIEVQFADPTHVDRLTFITGVDDEVPASDNHGAPRVIDAAFFGETGERLGCRRLELGSKAGAQERDIARAENVSRVQLHVRSVFPADNEASNLAAITEVVFSAS